MKTIHLKEIVLTENEREIFDLLLRAFSTLHPKTQLRVVGGWVRDKLMGQDSNDIKLFSLLFAFPSSSSVPEPGCGLAYMEAMWNLIQTHGLINLSGQETRLALYAALFLPFRKMVYKDTNKKQAPVVSYIFKVSMKRNRIDADTVLNIHKAVERFLRLILPLQMKNDDELQLDDPKHWECIIRNDPEVPGFIETKSSHRSSSERYKRVMACCTLNITIAIV